jgi:hypothetical protein
LENVLKCNVYCTAVEKFAVVNAIYAAIFPKTHLRGSLSAFRRGRGRLTSRSIVLRLDLADRHCDTKCDLRARVFAALATLGAYSLAGTK